MVAHKDTQVHRQMKKAQEEIVNEWRKPSERYVTVRPAQVNLPPYKEVSKGQAWRRSTNKGLDYIEKSEELKIKNKSTTSTQKQEKKARNDRA